MGGITRNIEMAELSFHVDKEAINQALHQAVLDSLIGNEVKVILEEHLKALKGYNSPIRKVVEELVHQTIVDVVRKDYADKIREVVKESITDELLREVTNKIWDSFNQKYH